LIRSHVAPDQAIESVFIPGAYTANRDAYLRDFKEKLRDLGQAIPIATQSENDLWALGRHFGLVSPVLDWTRNPLIAAFFALADYAVWIAEPSLDAVEEERRRQSLTHVTIWCLNCKCRVFREGAFERVKVRQFDPVSRRLNHQEAEFTRLTDGKHCDVQSYLDDAGLVGALVRYDLCTTCASEALTDLHDQGIHHAFLFPDVEGAAKYANMRRLVNPESIDELLSH